MEAIRFTRHATCMAKSNRIFGSAICFPFVLRNCTLRPAPVARAHYSFSYSIRHASDSSLPRVARPSVWRSMIPKPFRGAEKSASPSTVTDSGAKVKKPWNPATFFIVIFMLIGSQAIQSVALRTDFANFSRETETKLELLREVVQRLKAGEDVDVEGLLGTGDKKMEREWEDVLKELESEDALFSLRAERREKRRRRRENREDEGEATAEGDGKS